MKSLFFFVVIIFSGTLSFAQNPDFETRELVHLLDYLAQDYGGAVKDGHIISRSEYQEQLEFSETALNLGQKLQNLQSHQDLITQLTELHQLILNKSQVKEVSKLSKKVGTQIIKLTGLQVAPTRWPSLTHGQQLYGQTCVTCHGAKGDGNGPAAKGLNPKPINFYDQERMASLSPFKVFNAIKIGVPKTAMVSQGQLSDQEIWDLAFYVVSLRHQSKIHILDAEIQKTFDKLSKEFNLEKVATLNDNEISKKETVLAVLRTHSGDEDSHNSLQTARLYLKQAEEEYSKGNFDVSKSKALVAYLEGIEPVEPRLRASDPALTSELENRMAHVRSSIEGHEPYKTVESNIKAANQEMDLATLLLNQGESSPWVTFFIAAAILLREGFEAVLIIIALLGVIRASGATTAHRWVHGGWTVAVGLGVVTWFLSGWLMAISGAQRELMEGVTSIFAVLVLLYMGFWLHRTTEIGRWTQFINDRVKRALEGKKLFGLAIISFVAVFREAFETVLFLRALWLEGGMVTKWAMLGGAAGAFVLILFLAWIILKYTAKVPIRKLFDFSSTLMTLLAVILIGKGIHSLQETGLIGITASPLNLRIELFGVYPTLETMVGQIAVLVLALTLWIFGKKPSSHQRRPVVHQA